MTIPRNVQRGAVGVILLLTVVSLYRTFSTASELQQALETIQHVQVDLSVARDSLVQARTKVLLMTQEISHRQRELRRIREQVQEANRRHEAQREEQLQARGVLRAQWRTQEATRHRLHQEAQKFPVE